MTSPTPDTLIPVVVFAPYYPPAYLAGGPVKSISGLVRASPGQFLIRVVSRNWDLGRRQPLWPVPHVWVETHEETIWVYDRRAADYIRAMRAVFSVHPQVLYVNSLSILGWQSPPQLPGEC